MLNIGVVGIGTVGSAVSTAIKDTILNLKIFDKHKNLGSLEDILDTVAVFVCVQTPTTDGIQDLSFLCDVLCSLEKGDYAGIVIIKSTVLPGTMEWLTKRFPTLRLVHNPEFLTEKNALTDFCNQPAVLVSGSYEDLQVVENLYTRLIPARVLHFYDYKVTEMAKYVHNCFLATKVSFMNEIYDYCQKKNIKYDEVIKATVSQNKIGASHIKVPDFDGQRGFGGSCLPKDAEALLGSDPSFSVLQAAVQYNKRIRGQK